MFAADTLLEVLVSRFDGGISDNPRETIANQGVLSSHFDVVTDAHRLIPYRSSEEDTQDSISSTDLRQYFLHDFWYDPPSDTLYGYGQKASATDKPKIFSKTSPGASGNWNIPSTAEGGFAAIHGSFIKWTTKLWGFEGTTAICAWTIGSTMNDSAGTVGSSITSVAQSLISPTDNCMYMFYNNCVVRVDASGTVTDNVVPLPTGYSIRSGCLYGNYIAIGLSTGNSAGSSIVVLWMPTLSNFSEVVDFGDGEIKVLENISGTLIAVMDVRLSSTNAIAFGKLTVKQYAAGGAIIVKEIQGAGVSGTFPGFRKVLRDGAVYFPLSMTYDGATRTGIWVVRKNAAKQIVVTLAYSDANVAAANLCQGFAIVGDYFFEVDTSNGKIWKTLDSPGNIFTSIYESQKFFGNTAAVQKQAQSFFATYDPFVEGNEQVVMKYRVDQNTSWTTLFTETTANAIRTERGTGTGVALPKFREIQFRLESTGDAKITGFGMRYTELGGPTSD